jgi:hypothetical protein
MLFLADIAQESIHYHVIIDRKLRGSDMFLFPSLRYRISIGFDASITARTRYACLQYAFCARPGNDAPGLKQAGGFGLDFQE